MLHLFPNVSTNIIVKLVESAQPVVFLKLYLTVFLPSFALEGLKLLFTTASPLKVPPEGFAFKFKAAVVV